MKELSIEQKAKRYDEALKVLHKYDGANIMFSQSLKEEMFPELKESKDADEKVRKALIKLVTNHASMDLFIEYDIHLYEALAWLEKQGEQKPSDKVEPKFHEGDIMRTLEEAKEGITDGLPVVVSIDEEYYHCNNELISIKDQDEYEYPPMNRKQNPAWSEGEEDEKMIRALVSMCDVWATSHQFYPKENKEMEALKTWLKSFKDRIQPQPKQEWSEDEEELYAVANSFMPEPSWNAIIETEEEGSGAFAYDYSQMINMFKAGVNWFKSLRPQSQWKPSEEMLEALYKVISENVMEKSEDEMLLDKLYQGLKYGRVLSRN